MSHKKNNRAMIVKDISLDDFNQNLFYNNNTYQCNPFNSILIVSHSKKDKKISYRKML